ncbi:TVP38/TMEM64 family protein [Verrucomicrobiales bacterium]|jgi:uncharacterized membrane protein YdjX (TVP38/TMEM64 family)|nr:TVP38/TMEM64 family protein [Verrucomicrobiales bacterium]MDA7614186.1 TVP38/TMEM64 family protein [Verrucomicrobiales bacterium]MDA7644580.1 TVP38/TMEM64 family protein [Verrucomicrobiales bacterium]MDB4467677.1 TVP38/TMEM64 family protein [Verrucomicrobiales bacterium]MDF1785099.1 TVP38/TMEM64 family protein [Verrucomicrobiales bacterium]
MTYSSRLPVHKKVVPALIVVGLLYAAFRALPLADWLQSALDWVEALGPWGPVAFIILYALAVVFFFPASVMTLAAGTGFGVVLGCVYVSIASTLGATLAFLVGRHGARKTIQKRIDGNKTFTAIDSAVADEGWKVVGLTRLSPIFPFTLLNYAYGVTKVKFSHYVLASWIGMMPGTILYVYVGSLGKAAASSSGKTPLEWTFYGLGLLATIIVTVYVTKIAKRALNKKIHA